MSTERKRVCCNCGNNKRIADEHGMIIRNECAIDGHYIGYLECMEGWCRHWKKEKKKEKKEEVRVKLDVYKYPVGHQFTVVQCEKCGVYYEPGGKEHKCKGRRQE